MIKCKGIRMRGHAWCQRRGHWFPLVLVWRGGGGNLEEASSLWGPSFSSAKGEAGLGDLRHPYFWDLSEKSPGTRISVSPFLSILSQEWGSVLEEATSKLTIEEVSSWGLEAAHADAWR